MLGQRRVRAVDRRRRRHDHVHVPGAPRRLEHLDGAGRVDEVRRHRIGDRARHRRPRREVDDRGRVAHHLVERVGIEDGALDERDVEVAQVVAVAGREVVERDDGLTGPAQAAAEVRADETRASRHDDAHGRQGYRPFPGVPRSEHASATFLPFGSLCSRRPALRARLRYVPAIRVTLLRRPALRARLRYVPVRAPALPVSARRRCA